MVRTIEEIKKAGKYKVRLAFDSGEALFLSVRALERWDLREGKGLSEDDYSRLMEEEIYPAARKKAMDLLTRCDRSEKELRDKLRYAGFSEEAVNHALLYVNRYNYVDDERYAENFVEFRARDMSNQRLKMELRQRGIEEGLIEEYLDGRKEDEILRNQINKKLEHTDISDGKKVEKVRASFYRKGFSLSDINGAIKDFIDKIY